jgi:hypothetical protein
MAKWYIKRNGKQAGPFESAQLRQLAKEGKIKSDDLLRRDDQEAWQKAESVKGLLSERVEHPPSLNTETQSVSSDVSTQPSEDTSSFSFGASAKAVGQITGKKAELTKIQQVSLPAQYAKLGQKLFESNALKGEHEGLFAAIQHHCEAIAKLSQQSEQQASGNTISEKAKSLGSKAWIATKIKAEELQRRQKFIQLGEAVSEDQVVPADCVSEKFEIDRLRQRQKELGLEIDSVKVTLGGKGLTSWTTSRVVIAASIILGLLFLYGLRYGSRQGLEPVKPNIALSTESSAEVLDGGGFKDLQNAANQFTDATREQAALENRRVIAQAKEDKEREEKESERNRLFAERTEAEQKERDREEGLRQERIQKERLVFIETCLPNICFDTQNIILSKKLRSSGATVELLGKSIPQFNRLLSKKDWLGFLSFAQNYRYDSSVTPFKWEEYPEQREVYEYLNKFEKHVLLENQPIESWAMLIKTKLPLRSSKDLKNLGQSLFAIHIPLSLDCKIVWPEVYDQFYEPIKKHDKSSPLKGGAEFRPKGTAVSTDWKEHPDGGALFHWSPVGLYLVGVSQDTQFVQDGQFRSEAVFYHAEQITERLRQRTNDLRRKEALGQIDGVVFTKEIISEVISIYEDALVWLEGH